MRIPSIVRVSAGPVLGAATLLSAAGLSSCQSAGRLGEYDFTDRTVAAVYDFPPYPEVLTGPYFPGHPDDPVHFVARLGSRIAREVAAAGVRERLDSAATRTDVAGRLAARTSERAARLLRARRVDDDAEAEFLLEVRVRDYGIDAEEWEAAAHVFVDAEVLLLDGADGSEIWESHVRERDPLAPHIFGGDRARIARNVVTAAVLADLSVAELARALEHVADYAADRITERLRRSLAEVRGR